MEAKEKALEFFKTITSNKQSLLEIPMTCCKGEFGTLLYLSFINEPITASKLSQKLSVSLPRVTSLINSLETKGYIVRKNDENDKRKVSIHITEKGKVLVLAKQEEVINKIAEIFTKLGEKDSNEYIRIVKKIDSIIKEKEEN